MTEADQKRENDVLRRMLATKPKPHKVKEGKQSKEIDAMRTSLARPDFQKLELDVGRTPFVDSKTKPKK